MIKIGENELYKYVLQFSFKNCYHSVSFTWRWRAGYI